MLVRCVSLLAAMTFVACSPSRPRGGSSPTGGSPSGSRDAGSAPQHLGIETLGKQCTGACGSADERKCSITSEDCGSDLCLVDPAHRLIAYCTVDCTRLACPEGYDCEDIKAFGHDEVLKGCIAQPAECGDGVVQLGELCDGDDDGSMLGRCVECSRWEAVCGDGVIQAPEQCDGDTGGAYCMDNCSRLMHPTFKFEVHKRVANAVDYVQGNSTRFYGTGYQRGEVAMGQLPLAGDDKGCGAVRVLEATAELTRVEWTYCDDEDTVSVWTFAVPRTEVRYHNWDGPIPTQFDASVLLKHPDGVRSIAWDMTHMEAFEVRSYIVRDARSSLGDINFRLEQPDPVQSFSITRAELNLDIEMTHPAL